ncbi:MAG TPA: hypothetical protein ENI23_11425 [bacterium]|nr:hypothetical protein [bacterium]
MNNALIIGMGMVGKSTAHAFGIKKYYDHNAVEGFQKVTDFKEMADNRYIFICLPTPVKDGQYFVDDIIKIIDAIKQQGKQNVFIIRSTVYPGFANYAQEKLGIHSIVSNPEFLTEKTWKKDSEHPDRIVIGCDYPAYLKDVEGIYKARFKGVDIFTTDNKTAELSKLASNGFFSTKVIFANQIYDYAKLCGANYEMIKNIMYKSKFIGENHLEVFHQGGRGASGKCLKKDLEALADYTNSPLLRVVDKLNKKYISRTGKQ